MSNVARSTGSTGAAQVSPDRPACRSASNLPICAPRRCQSYQLQWSTRRSGRFAPSSIGRQRWVLQHSVSVVGNEKGRKYQHSLPLHSFVPCYDDDHSGRPDDVFLRPNNMVRDTLEQIDVTKQLAAQYPEVRANQESRVTVAG